MHVQQLLNKHKQ